jgi:hypothetical protein
VRVEVVRRLDVRRRTTTTGKQTSRFAEPYAILCETRWYFLVITPYFRFRPREPRTVREFHA